MVKSNFERMMQLADDVFSYRTDPGQISVNEEEHVRLAAISPHTMLEYDDGNGPVLWILLVPTSTKVMEAFLAGKITEVQLLEQTIPGEKYDAIYLCSALVLEEYRRKGISTKLMLNAINEIRKEHDIKALYVWPFTDGGDKLADAIADKTGLPLLKREG